MLGAKRPNDGKQGSVDLFLVKLGMGSGQRCIAVHNERWCVTSSLGWVRGGGGFRPDSPSSDGALAVLSFVSFLKSVSLRQYNLSIIKIGGVNVRVKVSDGVRVS
jgi:hypothetical protein